MQVQEQQEKLVLTQYRMNVLKNHLLWKSQGVFTNEANFLRIAAFNDFLIYHNKMGFQEGYRALQRAYRIVSFANLIDPMNKVSLWTLLEFVFSDRVSEF